MTVSGGTHPKYRPGSIMSLSAKAAFAEGAFVEITADKEVDVAAAGSIKMVGVALQTAGAAADVVPVQLRGPVFTMTAKGAVAAGDVVGAATDGSAAVSTIVPAAAGDSLKVAGIALEAIADGATGLVMVI